MPQDATPTDALLRFVHGYTPLSPTDRATIAEPWKPFSLRAGQTLLREGDRCPGLYFLHAGLLRYHYTAPDGEDVTKFFTEPPYVFPPPRPPAPTRRHFWASAKTSAAPAAIWRVWTDLDAWPDFDPAMTSAALDDGTRVLTHVGQRGRLVEENGRDIRWAVTRLEPGCAYTFTSDLPGGKLHVRRSMADLGDGECLITHEVWFGGPLGRPFALLLGGRFRSLLPGVVARVVEVAGGKS